jgi:two-component system, NarL family, sensor histidine kinase UhpB
MLLQEQNGNKPGQPALKKINEHSATIMDNMSDIVWAINPVNDTLEKIIIRVKTFAAEMLEPLNINYTIKEEGDFTHVNLDINKRKDFYLICKEAINNAAKYSQCKNIQVLLQLEQKKVRIIVTDDGIGFNEKLVAKGNGLKNMESRAVAMKGSISIESLTGKGTRIEMTVPVT